MRIIVRLRNCYSLLSGLCATINILIAKAGVGGVLHHIFGSRVQHMIKYFTESDLRFCENEGSKRSNINEKEVNWIENQEKNRYKVLKIC